MPGSLNVITESNDDCSMIGKHFNAIINKKKTIDGWIIANTI